MCVLFVDAVNPATVNGNGTSVVTAQPSAPVLSTPPELASPQPATNPNHTNGAYPSLMDEGEGSTSNPEAIVLQPQHASSQVIPASSEKKVPPSNEDWL